MADALTLRVITPERIALDTTAESVRIPALNGSMGILPRHAGMVTALDSGQLSFRSGGREQKMFVSGGFAEVRENTVRVVCEAGEQSDEIDEERARGAEDRARERLGTPRASEVDGLRAEASLRRALMRLRVRSHPR